MPQLLKVQYFTPEGLEKLKAELQERTEVIRQRIAARIGEARDLGDLSENAEYVEAKEDQGFNESRIEELNNIIKNAVMADPQHHQGQVNVGSTIKVKSGKGEFKFTVVGASESDPVNGFISNESPLGQAFLGAKKGETVEAKVPKGVIEYKILEIE